MTSRTTIAATATQASTSTTSTPGVCQMTRAVVPSTAVDSRSNVPAVFRIKGGKVERVPVTLGLRDDAAERIEIASGVQVGDTLLVGAAQGITPGTIVKVSSPSDKATSAAPKE